ncbi:helix-turn-helix domain-containing protein [Pseudodonghicola xiamenensis]|uniref:HTH cro/C1-type domain-containing protein n=1 Tax=Pseudodonghicola xiamenensis TaxID=337702 RepID=A0A8J3HAE2_9RHOB|nr:helix-turn-helix transcriptional regulator [Pseudodonghicola xiamenensis]GHG97496.1 hypothetical protein GCM10010961_32400 [Pseudodonghicola xiamenensis]
MGKSDVGDAIRIRLERLLELHSISKAELARRANLPSRTVENYFKGHAPSAEALFMIASGMHVPVDWLLGDLFLAMRSQNQSDDFDPIFECIRSAAQELLEAEPLLTTDELARKIATNARQKIDHIEHAYTAKAEPSADGQ